MRMQPMDDQKRQSPRLRWACVRREAGVDSILRQMEPRFGLYAPSVPSQSLPVLSPPQAASDVVYTRSGLLRIPVVGRNSGPRADKGAMSDLSLPRLIPRARRGSRLWRGDTAQDGPDKPGRSSSWQLTGKPARTQVHTDTSERIRDSVGATRQGLTLPNLGQPFP